MELIQLVAGFVVSIGLLIVIYNSMGTEKKPVKKDYSNEELSRAFARGCTKALFGDTKK
jgi:hypothetical protein